MSLRAVEVLLGALTSALLVIVTYKLFRATAKLVNVSEGLSQATGDLHAASEASNEIARDQTQLLSTQNDIYMKQAELADLLYRLNEKQLIAGVAPYLVMGQDDNLMRPRLEFTRVTRGDQEPQHVASLAITNMGQGPAVSVHAKIEAPDESLISATLPLIDSKEKTALAFRMNQGQSDLFRSAHESVILTLRYEDILGVTRHHRLRCIGLEPVRDAEGFLLILGADDGDENPMLWRTSK